MSTKRRVCIIGAGTAGLCALKHALEDGFEVTCYEQAPQLGGTWVYSENVDDTRFEDEIHSSMYQGLCTNLPKEVMCFPDLPYPKHIEESFVSSHEVLNYLNLYAEHFNLLPHIKYLHSVSSVRPWNNDQWEITVRDIEKDIQTKTYFDFLFVCNGHYTTPSYPQLEGMDIFEGKQMHSHLFRKADQFRDQTVLVIGAGPSGIDIANNIRKQAKQVFLSHHLKQQPNTKFMLNVAQKTDVKRFTKDGAIFMDDSCESFDAVIYCTGYKYVFPFLSKECGIEVIDGGFVRPLWKHCINIHYPSMVFIGLPFLVLPSQCFDLQVRFALKFYAGKCDFPSTDEMMADLEKDTKQRKERGISNRKAHMMGEKYRDEYYGDLSAIAGIDNIKTVVRDIMEDCGQKYIYQLETYRSTAYRIIDDEQFVKYSIARSG